MNNYHTVMSRFQVPASSVGFPGAPLPNQMGVYSSAPYPQFGAAPSPLSQQAGPPPFAVSGYPLYGAAVANLSGMDLKPFQSQPHSEPVGEIVAPAPLIHDGTAQDKTPKPSTPEPTTVPANTQTPDTPSKRIFMKSIDSYFASAKKPAFPLPIEDTSPISYPAYPKPSPPHATGDKERGVPATGLPPKYSEDLSSSTEDDTSSPIDKRMQGTQEQEHKAGDHHDWLH